MKVPFYEKVSWSLKTCQSMIAMKSPKAMLAQKKNIISKSVRKRMNSLITMSHCKPNSSETKKL